MTANGVEGSITYEFLAVPRHQGQFDIPPVEFVYFDTHSKQYKTLTSQGFHLTVEKGEAEEDTRIQDFSNQEEVLLLGSDIRHIKLGDTFVRPKDQSFFASSTYWALLLLLAIIFISLFVIFRRRAVENADLVKMRGKKANKVATKRLKKAAMLMKNNQPGLFYDEVLRALWGYVGDKLNIPVEQLSRENISSRLAEKQISEDTISQFIEAIDECEFVRYAPGDAKGNMAKVYEKAATAIEHNEKIKKV